jgi:predicted metal-binding transcription factor (methanogenesis marker protein 9)
VLAAVQGDDEAIKKVSEALVSGDAAEIRRTFSEVAKAEITEEQAQDVVNDLGPDPAKAVGYAT